ncbi:hypothetical protein EDB83DRAFT_2507711 [Lactarius deliciosus]|nr:hypothetical protein EDB83DRAFT_2507711 [Lactarius deliciosus]
MEDTGPVPLSFPSILRNSTLSSRFAHLVETTGPPTPAPIQAKKVWRRNDNEGKPRFTDNPHIAVPSKRDLEPPLPTLLTTAGQFSLSLRGMRKALRRSGARTEALVRGVEDELTRWLGEVAVVLNPALDPDGGHQFPGRAVAGEEGIREVERSPQRLVWWIENDTWARYVVHCCARYHNVVSFSKDTPTHRLTHILRPNVTRPDPATRATLATPPPTDLDFSLSSHDSDQPSSLSDVQSIDGASDVLSEADFASDPESPMRLQRRRVPLSDIASDADADAETGSPLGSGTDADADVAGGGGAASDLEQAEALSLANDDDETPRAAPRFTTTYRTRARVWDHHCRGRSGSSPSRSPARRKPPRRPLGRVAVSKKPTNDDGDRRESFYDYLFK